VEKYKIKEDIVESELVQIIQQIWNFHVTVFQYIINIFTGGK